MARKLPKTGNGLHSKIQVGSQTNKWAGKWQFERSKFLDKNEYWAKLRQQFCTSLGKFWVSLDKEDKQGNERRK